MKDRLISALVDACREVKCCKVEFCEKHHKECIDKLINCLLADAEGETVTNCHRLKWIPVTEPPEVWRDDEETLVNYLVYTPEYGVDIGNYMKPAKCWVCMGIPCNVTHWMPLPEQPKVALEYIVDLDEQTKANNAAMRKVMDFMTEGME